MHTWEQIKIFLLLAFIGAMIALGKLLQSMKPLSWRLVIGRMITGSATSVIAGLVLYQIPDMPFIVIMAIGSALGMMGAEFMEQWLKRFADKRNGGSR